MQYRIMALLALVALPFPPAAFAQAAQPFEGTWEATVPKERAKEDINDKIDDTVSRLNFVLRPFARSKLKEATKLCDSIGFEFEGAQLSIGCDDRPIATAPVNQGQSTYENEEGNKYVLVHKVGEGQILQVFADENGRRENRYTLSPDGKRIRMDVSIDSKQLPEPLEFSREFRKSSG